MEKHSRLAENLRLYQKMRDKTLAELSAELGVARSTVQSILTDGNTTVDTLVRMHNSTQLSLDELVFGKNTDETRRSGLFDIIRWFQNQPSEKQSQIASHLSALFELTR